MQQASQPAAPAPNGGKWRWHAVELARRAHRQSDAVYLGQSVRGTESYAVASARIDGLRYTVTMQYMEGIPQWHCGCPQGAMRKPCSHVGAALLLAAHRAEVVEAMPVAVNAGLTWSHVRFRSGAADGSEFYLVPVAAHRTWDTVMVTWDARHGRDVAVSCACGEIACAHIGAVALRREHDRQQRLRPQQDEVFSWWMRGLCDL